MKPTAKFDRRDAAEAFLMAGSSEKRLNFVMLAAFAYLYSPLIFALFLFKGLENGDFPVNADSIGIPLFGFFVLWIVGLPLVIAFCFAVEFILRRNEETN